MADVRVEHLLREMVNHGASDLHVRVGVPPIYRINGELQKLSDSDLQKCLSKRKNKFG